MLNSELYAKVEAEMSGLLAVSDWSGLRVAVAHVVGHLRRDLPTAWLILVAPSSSGKTELLRPIMRLGFSNEVASLTSRTLVSGMKSPAGAKSNSLLLRLRHLDDYDPLIVIKDMTTVLNLQKEECAAVMSQLREVHDGSIVAQYGNGLAVEWKGRVGVVAAVTYAIEQAMDDASKFGDRFVYFKVPPFDAMSAMGKILTRDGGAARAASIEAASEAVAALLAGEVSRLGLPPYCPPEEVTGRMMEVASLAMRLRTPVDRNVYSQSKDITNVQPPESPTRLFASCLTMTHGLMALRDGAWDEADWTIVRKLLLDCVPMRRWRVARAVYDNGGSLTTDEVAQAVRLPGKTVRLALDELAAAEVLERRLEGMEDKTYRWSLAAADSLRFDACRFDAKEFPYTSLGLPVGRLIDSLDF